MKQSEGTIKDFVPVLFENKKYVHCPYCADKISPGLMNITKHWLECSFNPTVLKSLEGRTLLIDEIKKQVKF